MVPLWDEAYIELARHLFRWTGLATLAEFQWFAGLSGNAAKAVIAPLDLVGWEDRFLFPEDSDALAGYEVPPSCEVHAFSLDGFAHLRRNTALLSTDLLSDSELGPAFNGMMHLPNHAIFDQGALVGV